MSASPMSFAQSYILASKVRTKLTKDASNPKASLRVLVTQANMLDNLMDHIATEATKRNKMHSVVQEQIAEEEEEEDSSDDDFEVDENAPSPKRRVSFSLPVRGRQLTTSVAEFEVESESDSDSDSYYYSSDEEDEEEEEEKYQSSTVQMHRSNSSPSIFRELPSINLESTYVDFMESHSESESESDTESDKDFVSEPETEIDVADQHQVPDLCRSTSLTDEEDFEVHDEDNYKFHIHSKSRYQETIEYERKANTPVVPQLTAIPHSTHHHHQRHDAIMNIEALL